MATARTVNSCLSVLCVVFACIVFILTAATITATSVPVYGRTVLKFSSFGFDVDGELIGDFSLENELQTTLTVVGCESSMFDSILDKNNDIDSMCAPNVTASCLFTKTLTPTEPAVSVRQTMTEKQSIAFFYIHCTGDTGFFVANMRNVNPGNEHLSTTQYAYIPLSMTLAILAAGITVLFGVYARFKRAFAITAYRLIALAFVLTTADTAIAAVYWALQSATGRPGVLLVALSLMVRVAERTVVLVLVLSCANGVSLFAPALAPPVRRAVFGAAVIYALCVYSYALFSSFFFLLLLLLVYAFIVRFTHQAHRLSATILSAQSARVRARGIPIQSTPVPTHRFIVTASRILVLLYIFLDFIIRLADLAVGQNSPWLSFALERGNTLTLLILITVLFRVRKDPVFFGSPTPPGGRRPLAAEVETPEPAAVSSTHVVVLLPGRAMALAVPGPFSAPRPRPHPHTDAAPDAYADPRNPNADPVFPVAHSRRYGAIHAH